MKELTVSEQISKLLEKMAKSLGAAKELLAKEYFEFAISRAYYAMFYATEALLLTQELKFSKHSAVISAFGQYFVKPGIFTPEHRKLLVNAFEDRTQGDYDFIATFSEQEANVAVENAGKFCSDLEGYLRSWLEEARS